VRASVALAAAAAVAMLLQTTVFPTVPGLPIVPDVVLVLAIYVAVRRQSTGGAVAAFLLGYFLDTFSGTLLGLNAFSLTAAYLAVQWLARHLWVERGVVIFGGVVREIAAVAVAALVAGRPPVWQHALGYGLAGVLVSALVAPAVFAAVAWEERLLGLA
jgi:rod shape-determining protein MreD